MCVSITSLSFPALHSFPEVQYLSCVVHYNREQFMILHSVLMLLAIVSVSAL